MLRALFRHIVENVDVVAHDAFSRPVVRFEFACEPWLTVPSSIRWTMSSSARLRAHQASQSTFTLRHARLTTCLPTAPWNRPNSARSTRRVLVPAR